MRLLICSAERTGGLLSANKICDNITQVCIEGYNIYKITADGKLFVIGGVPKQFSNEYIDAVKDADAIILLTSKPEFNGGLYGLLNLCPDIEIYASAAGLRNIKEIVNRNINEQLIKDRMEVCGIRFFVTPNLHWVDSVMAEFCGILFSGEAFSGYDGSETGLRSYYDRIISVNSGFVISAVNRLKTEGITAVCPSYGQICNNADEVFEKYLSWSQPKQSAVKAAVLFSSESGFTYELVQRAVQKLSLQCEVSVIDADSSQVTDAVTALNEASIIMIGTRTINRNAPKSVWDVVTGLDLVNKRNTPYVVFGSFGWAADGIVLIDKTLSAMGMKRVVKPIDVLFKPAEKDFLRIDKAVEQLLTEVTVV